MMRARFLAAAVFGLLIATGAWSTERDHLLPEGSLLGITDVAPSGGMLRAIFPEAYAGNVKFRMVDLPSFHTESVTALKEDAGAYRIFTLEPIKPLWGYETLSGDVEMKRCEIEIDKARALRILAASKAVLLETKFKQPDEENIVVTDGVEDHFAMPDDDSLLAGWTTYAPKDGKVAALYDMAAVMFDYCAKRDATALKTLDVSLSTLETRMSLQNQPQKAPLK